MVCVWPGLLCRSAALDCSCPPKVGLVVNPGKCELVACGGDRAAVDVSLFPHHLPLNTAGAAGAFALLGAPIGPAAFWQPAHSQSRVASAKPLLQALAALPDAQTSLLLLRQCAAFCKVAYAAWVTPTSAIADTWLPFDGEVLINAWRPLAPALWTHMPGNKLAFPLRLVGLGCGMQLLTALQPMPLPSPPLQIYVWLWMLAM